MNATVETANGVSPAFSWTTQASAAPSSSPASTPEVFARFVKMPRAKTPASGTPKSPVMDRNRSQVWAWSVAER